MGLGLAHPNPNPNPNPSPNLNPNPNPNPKHRKHRAAEKRNERFFTPMPDSLLEKARMENEVHTSLDTKQMANAQGGMETPMGMQVGLRRHAP